MLPLLVGSLRNVTDGLHRRWTENKQTWVGVFFGLGNPDRILAKEFLDCPEREVASLDMNQLGRWTSLADHRYEIGIRSLYRIAVLPGPIPDRLVIRLSEVNFTHVGQPGEQRCQARNQSR